MKKLIAITVLIALFLIPDVYASRKKQTPWWTLKRHWDNSVTKDDKLCLEYMSRVEQYDYKKGSCFATSSNK
jgi:hypothetical protein